MIHIAVCLDDNFIMPVTVLLNSIGYNKGSEECFIHAISINPLLLDNQKLLLQEALKYNVKIEFHTFDISKLAILDRIDSGRYSLSTFLRLYLPVILPNLSKVLYLDGDIIVRHSLQQLWNTNIDNCALAGVTAALLGHGLLEKDIHYDPQFDYINAGVLLMNLDYIRHNGILQQFEQYIVDHQNELYFFDQTVINNVLFDRKLVIDIRYNLYFSDFLRKYANYRQLTKAHRREVFHDPTIVHFPSEIKPWHKYCRHPYADEWDWYRGLTPYKHIKKKIKFITYRILICYYLQKLFCSSYYYKNTLF